MIFNKHVNLEHDHAFLSPSQWHWLNYDDARFDDRFRTKQAAEMGTRLHEFAAEAIRLGIKLPKNGSTLSTYVNDGIGFGMNPEQILYYSDNCFGTADTLSFKANKLRIHDLKTGRVPASHNQLLIYAAIFCLEYNFDPSTIRIETRIYQSDDVRIKRPTPEEITSIMAKIVYFDERLQNLRKQDG